MTVPSSMRIAGTLAIFGSAMTLTINVDLTLANGIYLDQGAIITGKDRRHSGNAVDAGVSQTVNRSRLLR